jgi:hypothetical protein
VVPADVLGLSKEVFGRAPGNYVLCTVKVSLGLGKAFAHKSWNNNEWTRNNHNTSNMPKHKRKHKKRAKCNGDSTSTKTFACPNGLCGEVFASKQGVSNHYLHYSQCYKVLTGSAAFWQQREEETNIAHATPFTQSDSDSEDDATQFDFDLEYPDAEPAAGTCMDVGQCLDMCSFTNVHAMVSQRGVNHTVNDFFETKLLKILEDASVPHFLYQDILN